MLNERLLRPAGAAFLILGLLAGCQTTGGAKPDASGAAGTGVGEAGKPAAKPGDSVAAAKAIRFDRNEFIGYTPERVLPVLGAPDFVRRDGNAQIWQYRATNCVLDLFLYDNGTQTQVEHAELRARVPGAEAVDSCYSRMRQERKTNRAG